MLASYQPPETGNYDAFVVVVVAAKRNRHPSISAMRRIVALLWPGRTEVVGGWQGSVKA